jgi:hypothetical protein
MRIERDIVAALMFMAIAAAGFVGAAHLRIGSAANMGSGYFPLLVSALLLIVASALLIRSVRSGKIAPAPILLERQELHGAGMILLSVFLFAALCDSLGMPLTIVLCTIVASKARGSISLGRAAVFGVALAAGSWLAFNQGLGLRFPVLPVFMGG